MVIRGFLLDIDGTLIDSNSKHLESWRIVQSQFGFHKTDEEILVNFAQPTQKIARGMLETDDVEQIEALAQAKSDYFIVHLDEVPQFEFVLETMQMINQADGIICFASSNYNRVIDAIIAHFGWSQIAMNYIGMDDVLNGKPDPEMLLKAAAKISVDPSECVMIGDSLYDIEAGKRAGMKTIGVCTGGNTPESFSSLNPDLILDQIGDLRFYFPLEF